MHSIDPKINDIVVNYFNVELIKRYGKDTLLIDHSEINYLHSEQEYYICLIYYSQKIKYACGGLISGEDILNFTSYAYKALLEKLFSQIDNGNLNSPKKKKDTE